MKKKWVIGKKDRRVLLIFQKVLAAAFAAIFVGLACNSSVSVERNGRLYEQQINLLENSNSFENSDLFTDILSEEIRGVTRLSSSEASWKRTELIMDKSRSISRNLPTGRKMSVTRRQRRLFIWMIWSNGEIMAS